jgi:glycerophosphoryl diester phosphodiesterase
MKNSYWFQVLKHGWQSVGHVWMPMAGYLLVVWLVSLGLLSPLASWTLNQLIAGKGELIVGNTELVGWMLSPRGLFSLTLGGSFALLSVVTQVTGLIWIARESETTGIRNVKQTVIRLFRAFPALFRFCISTFLLCLLLLLPLIAGLGVVYYFFLSAHDINFYLTAKPPVWYWALALGAFWTLIWACITIALFVRWIYLLPIWLDGVRSFKKALARSWRITKRVSRLLLGVICACVFAWILAYVLVEGGLVLLMSPLMSLLSQNIWSLFVSVCVYLSLAAVSGFLINLIGAAWTVCTLVACYQDHSNVSVANRPSEGPSQPAERHSSKRRHHLPSWILGLGLVTLGAVGIATSWLLLRNQNLPVNAPVIIAHRAGMHHAPENSLAALEIAVRQKADYAEIDVQRTLDGTIVVVHDRDLMKLARDPRRIAQSTYQDLSRVDIGSLFHPDFKGEPIARLSDFLYAAAGKIRLLIELKYYGEDDLLAGETLKLVRQAGREKEVQIMSLDLKGVRQIQSLAPEITVGYLFAAALGNLARMDVSFLAVPTRQATSGLTREAHENGLKVYAWTVNDVDGILDLMEVGIDGLITDDPALAFRAIKDIRRLSHTERLMLRFRHSWDWAVGVFDRFFTAGLMVEPPFGWTDDLMGIGFFYGHPIDSHNREEYGFEAFYRLQLTHCLDVTPDIQIYHAGWATRTESTVVVGGFRLRFSLDPSP